MTQIVIQNILLAGILTITLLTVLACLLFIINTKIRVSKLERAIYKTTEDNTRGFGHPSNINDLNPIVQFNIENSGHGATDQRVIIGSLAAAHGAYMKYGLPRSAADDAIIRDQFGTGCLFIQGFSEQSCDNEIFVSEIHIISSNTNQLKAAQNMFHNWLHYDCIKHQRSNSINFWIESDHFMIAKGSWRLSSNEYFEFTSLAGADIIVILKVSAIADQKIFSKIQKPQKPKQ